MSYESTAEPIKVGYLMDFRLPEFYPQEMRDDFNQPFDLVFDRARKQGVIDRPVEIVRREVEGLPKGSVKAVIDAFGELVGEGCLAVFGPHISENAIPTREAIEERFRVPAINVCGSDDWLGEWTFALPQGSMTDEPVFWADLLAKAGHTEVGVLVEQSLVGESYLQSFRRASRRKGIRIVAEAAIAQTAQDVDEAARILHEAKPSALVHCGFGFGIVKIKPALEALGWDPPRFTGTACATSCWLPRTRTSRTWPTSRATSRRATGSRTSGRSSSAAIASATRSSWPRRSRPRWPTSGAPWPKCCPRTG